MYVAWVEYEGHIWRPQTSHPHYKSGGGSAMEYLCWGPVERARPEINIWETCEFKAPTQNGTACKENVHERRPLELGDMKKTW